MSKDKKEPMRASEFAKWHKPTTDNIHLRDLPSYVFGNMEHPLPLKFQAFVQAKVVPLVPIKGYKVAEKQELLAWMTNSLIVAYKRGGCVADSANTGEAGVRQRVNLWKSLCDAKLAVRCVGSEQSKKLTRFYATGKLIKLRKNWSLQSLVNVDLERNSDRDEATKHGLVFVWLGPVDPATGKPKSSKSGRQPVALKTFCSPIGLEQVKRDESVVEAFNANVLEHSWSFKVADPETGDQRTSPLNPCLRLLHCGQFYRAQRYYSWSALDGQNLSKIERKTIRIDGEPVTELDFSASVIRMIYRYRNLYPHGDLYRPHAVFPALYRKSTMKDCERVRTFVKDATLRCLNVTSRAKAHSSVGKVLNESPDRQFLQTVIGDIEKTDIKGIVSRIVDAHSDLVAASVPPTTRIRPPHPDGCEPFFNQVGIEMITTECWVMKRLLIKFTDAKKPALMIHDGLVCKKSDATFARKAMVEAYQSVLATENLPVIKRAF